MLEGGRAGLGDLAAHLGRAGEGHDPHVLVVHERRAHPRRRCPSPCSRRPSGRPASSRAFTRLTTDRGVSVAGLITTVLPRMRAGIIFQEGIAMGKFQGVMRPAMPTGWRTDIWNLSGISEGVVWPNCRRPFAGHVVRHVDGFLDVAAGLVQDLAHLARHVARELLLAAHAGSRPRGRGSRRAWGRAGPSTSGRPPARPPPPSRRPPAPSPRRGRRARWCRRGCGSRRCCPDAAGVHSPVDVVPEGVAHVDLYAFSPSPAGVMSLLPLKVAPSAITTRGARMLPVSRPLAWISTRWVAWQSPTSSPATTTDWA